MQQARFVIHKPKPALEADLGAATEIRAHSEAHDADAENGCGLRFQLPWLSCMHLLMKGSRKHVGTTVKGPDHEPALLQ